MQIINLVQPVLRFQLDQKLNYEPFDQLAEEDYLNKAVAGILNDTIAIKKEVIVSSVIREVMPCHEEGDEELDQGYYQGDLGDGHQVQRDYAISVIAILIYL